MRHFTLTTALGAASLSLAACGGAEENAAENESAVAAGETGAMIGTGDLDANAAASGGGTSSFGTGSRIVEENGVTYRVDADGTRTALGENDSRIVVENGTRYRIDPDGARIRIDESGAAIDIDTPDIDAPDVDVGVNEKGNLDVDVKSKSDGDEGPN